MPPLEFLGEALLALRKRSGLTQAEVAERVGTSNKKIYAYEKGESMSLDRLGALLEAMGADLYDLGVAAAVASGRTIPDEGQAGGSVFTPEQLTRLDEEAQLTAYGLTVKHLRKLRGQAGPDLEDLAE